MVWQSWRSSPQNPAISLCERSFYTTGFLLLRSQVQWLSFSSFIDYSELHLTWCWLRRSKPMGDYLFYNASDAWRLRWVDELCFHSGPRICLNKIHSYSSATILHITGAKVVLEGYPNLQSVDFQTGSAVGKHWQTEGMSLSPLSHLKQGLWHGLHLILGPSFYWLRSSWIQLQQHNLWLSSLEVVVAFCCCKSLLASDNQFFSSFDIL